MSSTIEKKSRRSRRQTAFSVPALMLAAALALALVAAYLPVSAQAYYTFGTVKVSTGASSLSVKAGSSTSTSVKVSPSSDRQTQGCGMAKCPQVCGGDGAIEAGYTCFDENGQCTCAGTSYSTYYADVSASSSNSSVATASVSGGTLVIKGKKPGEATITVNASLRQWNSNSTRVKVTVNGSAGSSAGGSAGSSSVSVPETSTTPLPQAADPSQSRDDALNEQVIKTTQGMKIYSVEINSYLDTAAELKKVAGKKDECVFWSGASSATPDYSWTFDGEDVDVKSANLDFDPTITVSEVGTGNVSNIMDQAKDGIVLDFAHEGQLPGKATVYVKADGAYADGTELTLFTFDDEAKKFVKAQDGIKVSDKYASFTIDHCSTWALSTDDLASYEVQEAYTPKAIASDETIGDDARIPVMPIVIGIIVAAAIVVVIVVVARSRRRAADTTADDAPAADAEETPRAQEAREDAGAAAETASETKADEADAGR